MVILLKSLSRKIVILVRSCLKGNNFTKKELRNTSGITVSFLKFYINIFYFLMDKIIIRIWIYNQIINFYNYRKIYKYLYSVKILFFSIL